MMTWINAVSSGIGWLVEYQRHVGASKVRRKYAAGD
jgi:hypothetical protein